MNHDQDCYPRKMNKCYVHYTSFLHLPLAIHAEITSNLCDPA